MENLLHGKSLDSTNDKLQSWAIGRGWLLLLKDQYLRTPNLIMRESILITCPTAKQKVFMLENYMFIHCKISMGISHKRLMHEMPIVSIFLRQAQYNDTRLIQQD